MKLLIIIDWFDILTKLQIDFHDDIVNMLQQKDQML